MSKFQSRKPLRRKDLFRALGLGILLVVLAVLGWYLVSRWESLRYRVDQEAVSPATPSTEAESPKTITYNQVTYTQRPDLETYLFMGVDVSGEMEGTQSFMGGGQADTQMVLVLDHQNQTWQILQLNRDTMVEMPVLGLKGDVVGSQFQQLTLAYSYGNGREESCENTLNTVSALLEDQPFDGYLALDMDAVGILTDLVGGVPILVTSDFSAVDPSLVEGEWITLQGDQALTFVRTRKDVDDQTNLARMARQRQFLSALEKQLEGKDAQFAAQAYQAVADYMVSSFGSGTASRIAQDLSQYTQLELLTIDGQAQVEDGYMAYYLDQDSLMQTILELFYEES